MFLPTLIAKQKPGEVGPDNLVLNASYLTVPSQKKATKKKLPFNHHFFPLTLSSLHFSHHLSCSALCLRIEEYWNKLPTTSSSSKVARSSDGFILFVPCLSKHPGNSDIICNQCHWWTKIVLFLSSVLLDMMFLQWTVMNIEQWRK